MLTPVAALHRADLEFRSRLALVPEAAWDERSACDDWSVGDLVDHVVGGNVFTIEILNGSDAEVAMEAAISRATSGAARRRSAYRESACEMLDRFADDDALAQNYDHVGGRKTGAEVAALRTEDIALHAWDLARSIDGDEALDSALVEFVWERMSRRADELAASGRYGAGSRTELGNGMSLQARLLDITGRNHGRSLG